MKAAKAFGASASISSSRLTLAAGRAALGAFVGTAAALALFASAAKAADNRTLDLYNMHTKERLTITFRKDGRYVPSALAELNRFLRDWRRNEATRMDPRLFDTVWELYQKSGSHQPIQVVCGYRSLATNNMLRSRSSAVAKHSQHSLGKAMDMNIPDVSVDKLRMIGVQMQNGGVGWYPSANSPFVHIDVGSVRAWPRLTRTQLVGLFPNGKTAHIPADGKPLPGYQQALAELQREKGTTAVAMASANPSSGGKGLLAMLFSNDEEDNAEEVGSANGEGDAPAVATKLAPVVMPKPTPPVVAPAVPTTPVLTAAFTPPVAPVAPERRVTSLAEATLPANLEPAAVPQLTGADRLAMDNVPLPQAKPSEIAEDSVEVAMADAPMMLPPVKPPAPVEVPLPMAASRQDDAIAAQLALAEVAQDQAPQPASALSFAPPAEAPLPVAAAARQPVQMAALSPTSRKPAPPPPTAELARPVIDGGKSDMFGNLELPETASEDGPLLLDGSQSVYWGRFRTLTHPDQLHLATMFEAPAQVVNTTFSAQPYGALVSTRFAGPVAAPTEVIDSTRRQLAMR
ncbi:MAG: peptidase [Proteobacteria bacterium]|nr:peptidase [Pseudomonadota bacterium]